MRRWRRSDGRRAVGSSVDPRVGSSSGPTLTFRSTGAGQLSPTADGDGFSHGTVMYEVTGGTGMFEQAQGFITSNFLVNLTTNELLDTHLGVLQL